MIKLRRIKGFPYYRQISNYIEECITKGVYPVGMKLHTERELALLLNVNRSTVHAAYEELRAKGVVESNVSVGTIVTSKHKKYIRNNTPPPTLSHIQQQQSILQHIQIKKYTDQTINFHQQIYQQTCSPIHLFSNYTPLYNQSLKMCIPKGMKNFDMYLLII